MKNSSPELGKRIYRNIKNLSKAKHIPMNVIEENAGISSGYLSRASKHGLKISFEPIFKIAKMLDVSLEYIFENEP